MAFAPATQHTWNFYCTSGLEQVALATAEDLLALDQLDQKLWVALACPVKGTELDEETLALIDTDGDGFIQVREVIAAVRWACERLKNPADLLSPAGPLPLASINDAIPGGATLLGAARHILESLGRKDAVSISVEDTMGTERILAARAPNGSGVITLRATNAPETQALIKDIMATVGGVPDRVGGEGVNAAKVEAFFAQVDAYLQWLDATAAKNIPEFGEATGAACAILRGVRPKVADYFARCRLAAFDGRAVAALNRPESDYVALAAKELSPSPAELAAFPLSRVTPEARLPLLEGVNPAWADALAEFQRTVVTPFFGPEKTTLTADEWDAITARFAAYEAWLGGHAKSPVERLGAARAKEVASGPAREALAQLLAQDQKLAPDYNALSSVARLARYHRDLRSLLHNFVNFADFYSDDRFATFQAGTLYLDSRSCDLCIRVNDAKAHALLAPMSKAYVAYLDCRRGPETMTIAACFTQGDSDHLFVGRNGLFYDRRGRDWHANITRIIDNPISIRQAFWSPYKKFIRMVEDLVAKRAAAADTEATARLQTATTTALTAAPASGTPAATAKKFDVGTIAALGVGLGALTTAFGMIFGKFVDLPGWQIPLAVAGIILAISLPSMVIAWLKIRQRTVGPLLEANGWAINGRVRVNVPFGTALTERALLPANAKRMLDDPYRDRTMVRRRRLLIVLALVVAAAALAARLQGTWPFEMKFRVERKAEPPAGKR